ncbi:hypothetical protein JAAARDRAFT_115773, partial [Jaapia argillacea MUCL 33604]
LKLICLIITNNPSDRKHDEHVSWWPKQITWEAGYLDAGYWTPTAESWFQARMRSIRDGTAKPKNATQW